MRQRAIERDNDERILSLLARRTSGETTQKVAKRLRLTEGYVRSITNRVLKADINESGEPLEQILSGYWRTNRSAK